MIFEKLNDVNWTLVKEFGQNKVYGMTVAGEQYALVRWEHYASIPPEDPCFVSHSTHDNIRKPDNPLVTEFRLSMDELDDLCR